MSNIFKYKYIYIYNSFNRKLNRKGFSLIELSIVLAIVSLIIAGIIIGKNLINEAKINTIISEMNTIDIAIENYVRDNNIMFFLRKKQNHEEEDKYYGNIPTIKFSYLVRDGYLDGKVIVNNNCVKEFGQSIHCECYKSKISPHCWVFDSPLSDSYSYTITLGQRKSNTDGEFFDPFFNNKFITQFENKFLNKTNNNKIFLSSGGSPFGGFIDFTFQADFPYKES